MCYLSLNVQDRYRNGLPDQVGQWRQKGRINNYSINGDQRISDHDPSLGGFLVVTWQVVGDGDVADAAFGPDVTVDFDGVRVVHDAQRDVEGAL